MKAPVSWLKEYVPIPIPATELAAKLTLAGSEVSRIERVGSDWRNIVVGQITAVDKHPHADRLNLVTVNIGSNSPTVVTGAPNVKVGDKVAFAGIGVELIDGHTGQKVVLKPAVLRGVESAGMVLSERELGISDAHEGILILQGDAPVGIPLSDILGEDVLDLEITPNRVDCLSIIGLARETGAVTDAFASVMADLPFKVPGITFPETGAPIAEALKVEIAAADLCPRYTAGLIRGIRVGQSPQWLKKRLTLCGMRPINNVVDITNYVMLEYGQPLHAFDAAKIGGSRITVRRAAEGEKIIALASVERSLTGDTLVIADDAKAIAIAGVMGGENSEVGEATRDIVIESASFKASSIHCTASALRLGSEASMRFERNLSPELASYGLRRAMQLILEICGGAAASGIIDVYPGQKPRWERSVRFSFQGMFRIIGFDYGTDKALRAMKLLGLEWIPEVSDDEGDGSSSQQFMRIYVPYWRSDLAIAEDIYEEIARILGYDLIPPSNLAHPIPKRVGSVVTGLRRALRLALAGFGFQEMLSYSLESLDTRRKLNANPDLTPPAVKLANPMSAQEECLRTSLRPALLSAIAYNRKYDDGGLRLFEVGRVYQPKAHDLPAEVDTVCAVVTGRANQLSWKDDGRSFDFFDVKGLVESILGRLNAIYSVIPGSDDGLRPSYQAEVRFVDPKLNVEQKLGVFGEIHPQVIRNFELAEPVYVLEISLPMLLRAIRPQRSFQSLARYPSVERDLALVLDEAVPNTRVVSVLESFPLVKNITLFDVYTGKQVPPGKKSLAYRLTLRSDEGTLTDQQADDVQKSILSRLAAELGAALRT